MLLIGSRALQFWNPDLSIKKDADWDVIISPDEYFAAYGKRPPQFAKSWKHDEYEFHNAEFLNNAAVAQIYNSGSVAHCPGHWGIHVCNLRGLAVIKRSHLHRPISFSKHIRHYQLLDNDFDCVDETMLDDRIELTKKAFGDKTPSLNATVEDFFDDYVKKYLVHDDVHDIVAHEDEPLYKKMQRDPTKVMCHKDMWEHFTEQQKVHCVQEETYVIAIERYLIPNLLKGKKYPYRMAFENALERVCTTLCGGFFRDYAIDHWEQARRFDETVFDKFFNSETWRTFNDSFCY